jgi:hypothetical protein
MPAFAANNTKLFPQTQGLNDRPVAPNVFALQVVQHSSSLTNQFQQAPSGMMIFLVGLEMLVKMADTLSQKGNLDLR